MFYLVNASLTVLLVGLTTIRTQMCKAPMEKCISRSIRSRKNMGLSLNISNQIMWTGKV